MSKKQEQVYSITTASESHGASIGTRERRYLISMTIRTLCFIGGVLAWQWQVWLGATLFVGAIFLPYVAVVMANAGVRHAGEGSSLLTAGKNEIDLRD